MTAKTQLRIPTDLPGFCIDIALGEGRREHRALVAPAVEFCVVGQNVEIEYRWTEGTTERLPALVRELIDSKVDIIVVAGADSTRAAKAATTTIPIVMAASQDAVGDGLVASLAHPGGNVTGQSVCAPELTSKRMEILNEMFPTLVKVGILWNKNVGAGAQLREAEATGLTLGVSIVALPVQIPDGLDEAMGTSGTSWRGCNPYSLGQFDHRQSSEDRQFCFATSPSNYLFQQGIFEWWWWLDELWA